MPQATPELRAEWPDDGDALACLALNFKINRGGIIYPTEVGYEPTQREWSAINYLLMEWDYDYSDTEPRRGGA